MSKPSIVVDALRCCTLATLAVAGVTAFTACADVGPSRSGDLAPEPAVPALATVTEVTVASDGTWVVRFDRQMEPDATAAAVRLKRLRDHVGTDLEANSDDVEVERTWQGARTLRVHWAAAAGSYVLVIGQEARTAAGAALDGLAAGVVSGLHRPDDDGLVAPSDYISQVLNLGADVPRFQGLPANAYMLLTEVTAYRADSANLPRDQDPLVLWRYGQSRVALAPPHWSNLALRLEFASPAGFPYNLADPGSMARAVQVLRSDGARFNGSVGLSHDADTDFDLTSPPRVVAAYGRTVTLTTGPEAVLASLRKPQDPLWLLLGTQLPPRGLLAQVAAYNGSPEAIEVTLDESAVAISGTVWGVTVSTDVVWPAGALDGGFSLAMGTVEFPIATATDRTLWLREPAPVGPCADCRVVLRRIEERAFMDDPAFFTSHVWYYFPEGNLPQGQRLLLSLNEDGLLRSIMGRPFRDAERDGDESVVPAVGEDEHLIAFSTRSRIDVPFDATRVNDGTVYETVFDALDLDCRGARDAPVCVRSLPDPVCGEPVPAQLLVSFMTSDGDATRPYGRDDFLDLDSLAPEWLHVLDGVTAAPLAGVLDTRILLSPTSVGTFPTTVLVFELTQNDASACGGRGGLRGFRAGDKLVLSHKIRPVVTTLPRTLDGDGDGVATDSIRDNWIGIWDEQQQTFAPLVRSPRRE